jgi:hypothetical protein
MKSYPFYPEHWTLEVLDMQFKDRRMRVHAKAGDKEIGKKQGKVACRRKGRKIMSEQ